MLTDLPRDVVDAVLERCTVADRARAAATCRHLRSRVRDVESRSPALALLALRGSQEVALDVFRRVNDNQTRGNPPNRLAFHHPETGVAVWRKDDAGITAKTDWPSDLTGMWPQRGPTVWRSCTSTSVTNFTFVCPGVVEVSVPFLTPDSMPDVVCVVCAVRAELPGYRLQLGLTNLQDAVAPSSGNAPTVFTPGGPAAQARCRAALSFALHDSRLFTEGRERLRRP